MTAPVWTHDDTRTEIRAWIRATTEQRDDAFLNLLATVCATAECCQSEMAINALREIGTTRDGIRS